MSFVLANRVKETTLTAGTGILSLLGAVSSFQSFGSVLSSGDQTYYTLSNSTQWEVGIGTYLSNSLRRDTVLSSSNSNNFVNLSGSTNVFIAYPAEKSVYKNTDGRIVVGSNGILFSDGTIQTTAPTGGGGGGSGTTYYAGVGLDLTGTTFSIDASVVQTGDNVSVLTNDAGYLVSSNSGDLQSQITSNTFNISSLIAATGGYLTEHPSITAASSSDNSGRTYIQDILLDSNGHVTGVSTATETVTDTNTTYTAGTGLDLVGTVFNIDNTVVRSGDNISVFINDAGYLVSANSGDLQNQIDSLVANTGSYLQSHPAISAASSSDNSNRTYIQDILLDEYGHVTGISTATETGVGGGGVTYFAGTGLTLDVDTFNIDGTVIQSGDNVSLLINDAGYITEHPTITAASSSDNSGRTYIQDILLDANGHVTGIAVATETFVDTDTTYSAGAGLDLTGTVFSIDNTVVQSGDNVSIFVNDAGYLVSANSGDLQSQINTLVANTGSYLQTHPSISAASSSDNSGRTYIQDVLLDSNGHVTGITTATETVVDTDTTYTAGVGLNLSGTEFSIENTVAESGDNVSIFVNDAGYLVSANSGDLQSQITTNAGNITLLISETGNYLQTHPIVSAASSSDNSDRTYIQDILLDEYGHVTGINTATEIGVGSGGSVYYAGTGLTLNGSTFNIDSTVIQSGDNISVFVNDAGYITSAYVISSSGDLQSQITTNSNNISSLIAATGGYLTSHPNITAAASSDNSGRTYIQDILLDANGHVTGVATATETVVDTDTTYTAGTGLVLFGTEFNIDSTVLQTGDNVSLLINDSNYAVLPTGGTEGQILYKSSDISNDLLWIDNYATELRKTIKNDTGSTILKGTVVMSTGAVGDTLLVSPAVGDGSVEPYYILGVSTEDILDSSTGYVTTFGPLKGISTSGYTEGDILWLDPNNPGSFINIQPESPNLSQQIGFVTSSHATNGRIFVKLWSQQLGLHELHDVYLTDIGAEAPSSGDALFYNGTVWTNNSTFVQSGDNISVFTNDTGYITSSASGDLQSQITTNTNNITTLISATGSYLTEHPSITAASSSDNSGRTYIQDILLDSNGHVTGIATATETVVDTDTTYSAGDGLNLAGTVFSVDSTVSRSGDNVSNFVNDAGYITSSYVISSSGDLQNQITGNTNNISLLIAETGNYLQQHPVISAALSSDNSGRTYIQDILLDGNGHVTGIATATETVVDTDTTYSAGAGLNLAGTVFSIDDTVAQSGDNVSIFVNDAGYLTAHPVISAASSSDNSGRTYIQDILLDSNGHVTGIATATETVSDNTYTAGTGLTLVGDTFHTYGTGHFDQITFNGYEIELGTESDADTYGISIGYRAGKPAAGYAVLDADYSIYIGYYAGFESYQCFSSIFLGNGAGYQSQNSDYCVFVGDGAGQFVDDSFYNNYLGFEAGYEASGDFNNYIGYAAGYQASGDKNIEIVSSGGLIGPHSNKLNIGNVLVGDTSTKELALGNVTSANLAPEATLHIVSAPSDLSLKVDGSGQFVGQLNLGVSGVRYSDGSEQKSLFSPVSSTAATGITLLATDIGKYIRTTAATAVTVTVPSGLSIPSYSEFVFEQAGAGQITLSPAAGVTINTSSSLTSAAQYSVIGIKQVSANIYTAFGDRT